METRGPGAVTDLTGIEASHVTDEEVRALDQVARDLAAKYPQLAAGEIRALVDASAAGFIHARIRTFVPLLVAREVRTLLQARTRT